MFGISFSLSPHSLNHSSSTGDSPEMNFFVENSELRRRLSVQYFKISYGYTSTYTTWYHTPTHTLLYQLNRFCYIHFAVSVECAQRNISTLIKVLFAVVATAAVAHKWTRTCRSVCYFVVFRFKFLRMFLYVCILAYVCLCRGFNAVALTDLNFQQSLCQRN